jgi:hypothetical protein
MKTSRHISMLGSRVISIPQCLVHAIKHFPQHISPVACSPDCMVKLRCRRPRGMHQMPSSRRGLFRH